jgi:hypothetical protein
MRMWPIVAVVAVFGGIGTANVLRSPSMRSEDAAELQARLDQFPNTVGPWKGTAVPVPEKQLLKAEAQAYLSRLFVHESTKDAVSVLLLAGAPGPLGAHDPEVCFAGAGMQSVAAPTAGTVPGTTAELWTGRYTSPYGGPTETTVSWGWGVKGVWKASKNPRLDYSGRQLIFKLYVSRVVTPAGRAAGRDPAQELLAPLLRELETRLNRPAPTAAGGALP